MKKMFKDLFKISLVMFILIFTLTGCKSKKQDETTNTISVTPIFYKITKNDIDTTLYLLGSIHAADDSIYPLNNKIISAYNESDYLAVELDAVKVNSSYSLQMKMAKMLLYEDGIKIKDELGEELYTQMIEILQEKDLYMSIYDVYKPAFFQSLLENAISKDAGLDAEKGVDMYFIKLAKEDEKEILEVESLEIQCNLLTSNPIELDRIIISDYVKNYDKNISEIKNLYSVWKQGNESEAEKLLNAIDTEELTEEEIKLVEEYNQRLINNRNYYMTDILEQYMNEGKNVFCTVGLGHVIGEEGIVKLMEKKGYNVEKIKY